ncbi:MAG: hypothetical protein ACRDVN_14055 [Jiangellaceae bacterium]
MKRDSATTLPPPLDNGGGAAPLRVQILATEHWSLLATRSMTWNEIFSRTGTFLTVLSAAVIALSLVAQATGFDAGFRVFALLVLPIVLLVGLGTYIRLVEADVEDAWLVVGMNRLRHAYLELAPELDPYFVTSHHDDELSVLRTYSFRSEVGVAHLLCGSPVIVGIIDSVVTGTFASIVCQTFGWPIEVQIAVGFVVALATVVMLAAMAYRRIGQLRRDYHPRFPESSAGPGGPAG